MIAFRRTCRASHRGAFSLVEVVLALGITTFCLISLMGLFALGLQTEKVSSDVLKISHLAQGILTERRIAPSADLGEDFPIPALLGGTSAARTTVKLNHDGRIASGGEESICALSYRIDAPPAGSRKGFTVYLDFYWPAHASPSTAEGHCEMLVSFPCN